MSRPIHKLSDRGTPVLGFAAYSGTGKTTLLTQVLPVLRARSVKVGLVKHAHHRFEIDHEGKDSFELRKSGASPVLVASRERWALIQENEDNEEPGLDELVARVDALDVDLILVEGFKSEPLPKVELVRPSLKRPLLYPRDARIVAVASDAEMPDDPNRVIPVLDLNDANAVADFVIDYMRVATSAGH